MSAASGLDLRDDALDRLLPMHLGIGPDGRVIHAGPTLTKMIGQGDLAGRVALELITIRRPAAVHDHDGLCRVAGQRLGLVLAHAPHLPLRGVAVVLPDAGGVILDLSLGLSFSRGVAEFGLTLNDFSPCDQTIELLYLHEANSATAALSQRLTTRLQHARAEAQAQAMTDPLTGLANRRAMDAEINRALADHAHDFGLMQIDLDLFKRVNDSFGHAAGDAVLERVGHILRHQLRLGDMAARVGGDEFIVLVRDCTTPDDLGRIATRLIAACEVPVSYRGQLCRISASIGIAAVASYPQRPDLDQLLADADAALYAAKRAGRGRYAFHGNAPVVASIAVPVTHRRRADDLPPGGFRRRQNDRVPRLD